MKVRFTFLHDVEIEVKTRRYVEKKVEASGKALTGLTRATVEIDQDKRGEYRVEVEIKQAKDIFRAEETAKTVEMAIDLVERELQEQIRASKEKELTLTRRGARSLKKRVSLDPNARL